MRTTTKKKLIAVSNVARTPQTGAMAFKIQSMTPRHLMNLIPANPYDPSKETVC